MAHKAGADGNGDVKQASFADSNLSNYGSKEMKDLRKAAASTDKELAGCGTKAGLEIWRVENRRTKDDAPDFGVKRWPKEDYGHFYSGDSYLVLNTYELVVDGKKTGKLAWDVHFWLGKDSSQDEIGVAAYKAIEIDDLLNDGPIQHREVQGYESALFQSYFKGITYMEGGIASGFRHVKPEEYKPRLFQVIQAHKTIRAIEVPVKASSMNQGDVFILDAGVCIYVWMGAGSNAFEKSKAGAIAHNIEAGRDGKARIENDPDDAFWKILGGTEKDVKPASDAREVEDLTIKSDSLVLYELSDSTGKMSFSKVAEGKLSLSMLKTEAVYIVDGGVQLFVWVGKRATKGEKSQSMKYAEQYIKNHKRPETLPVMRIHEGQVHHVFGALFA